MSEHQMPMYWIKCDGPDCRAESPADYSEYKGHSGVDEARDTAQDNEWVVDLNGKDYCPDHVTHYPCNTRGCKDTVTREEYRDDIEDCIEHRKATS